MVKAAGVNLSSPMVTIQRTSLNLEEASLLRSSLNRFLSSSFSSRFPSVPLSASPNLNGQHKSLKVSLLSPLLNQPSHPCSILVRPQPSTLQAVASAQAHQASSLVVAQQLLSPRQNKQPLILTSQLSVEPLLNQRRSPRTPATVNLRSSSSTSTIRPPTPASASQTSSLSLPSTTSSTTMHLLTSSCGSMTWLSTEIQSLRRRD